MSNRSQWQPIIAFFKKRSTLYFLLAFAVCFFLLYPIKYKMGRMNPPERSVMAAFVSSLFAGGILSAIINFFTLSSSTYWLKPIVELTALISRADGKITVKDQKVIIASFSSQFGYFQSKKAYRYFHKIKESHSISTAQACSRLNEVFEAKNATVLMDILVKIAVADQYLSRKEETVIKDIAARLRIHPSVLSSILARRNFIWESQRNQQSQNGGNKKRTNTSVSGSDRAFGILGIPVNSPFAEVKKAYRGLAKVYHPDKVMKGVNKEMAKKQFLAISEAYQLLKERIG